MKEEIIALIATIVCVIIAFPPTNYPERVVDKQIINKEIAVGNSIQYNFRTKY